MRAVSGVRFFNTTGPCDPARHYTLPAAGRLPRARRLIEEGRYFVVHAPRQTGKTTAMTALAGEATATGQRAALLVSVQTAGPLRDDVESVEHAVLDSIRQAAGRILPPRFRPPALRPGVAVGNRLVQGLTDWAVACPLPLVLILDEIDALQGAALSSLLSQLRAGFSDKPRAFPDSVVLCGMRDLKDYRVAAGSGAVSGNLGSPFNIIEGSLRVGDFSRAQVAALYRQRTEETGQEFTPEAVERAYDYSQGQPWLVNALAYEITSRMMVEPPVTITAEHVDAAREGLILSGDTHLDSLSARLRESRVRRFIEPLLAGSIVVNDLSFNDDLRYVRDLGLVAQDNPLRVANPIYREIIARDLAAAVAAQVTDSPARFLRPDGRLDFPALLDAFVDFWLENGEFMTASETYHEAAAQLVFMGFLQRIVNGGGFIDREYAVGSGRTDILVRKPYGNHQMQREAIELKAWAPGKADPLKAGLKQLDGYLDRLRLDTGTLIIFDRRPTAPGITDRTRLSEETTPGGRTITLLRA
jgi:hypothetical protein